MMTVVTVLAELDAGGSAVVLRKATAGDVPAIVELLAADPLGAVREGTGREDDLVPYLRAFSALDSDPAHLLIVADNGGEVVATLQLSFLPGMAHRGSWRAQIEGVRVTRPGVRAWEPAFSHGRSPKRVAVAAPWSS